MGNTKEIEKNPIRKIDFSELRKQKKTLVSVMNTVTTVEETNDLIGILHMIDAIQDYAVDELGWDEKIVFDFDEEENRED